MSGYTPGPWVVNGAGGSLSVVARLKPAGVLVSAYREPAENEEIPNARLIVAAPELLEAAKEAMKTLTSLRLALNELSGHKVGQYVAEGRLRAVIAKAEGK